MSDVVQRWERYKKEIKNISIKSSKILAKIRRSEEQISKEMKQGDFSEEILNNIRDKLESIKKFKNKGDRIRTKSYYQNDIYEQGKEISRKEEIKNGQQRSIFKLKNENTFITDK